MKATDVLATLKSIATVEQKQTNEWFFKTGPGEYGEGDSFLGVKVPPLRKVSKQYKDLPLSEVKKLLGNKFHEVRLCALFILVLKYERSKTEEDREEIVETYLKALDDGHVNNWDLVDGSAHKILGRWLKDKDRQLLHELSRSRKLWHERVSMMACYYFIQDGDFGDALTIAEQLVNHEHDLIHKVVGWMLREIGKKDREVEELFLKKHQKTMPRTMLRYAIEKFPEPLRKQYLQGEA